MGSEVLLCRMLGHKKDAKHSSLKCTRADCTHMFSEEELHDFVGCRCKLCGAKAGLDSDRHEWKRCICGKCGAVRDSEHNFQLVGRVENSEETVVTKDSRYFQHIVVYDVYRCSFCGREAKTEVDSYDREDIVSF